MLASSEQVNTDPCKCRWNKHSTLRDNVQKCVIRQHKSSVLVYNNIEEILRTILIAEIISWWIVYIKDIAIIINRYDNTIVT